MLNLNNQEKHNMEYYRTKLLTQDEERHFSLSYCFIYSPYLTITDFLNHKKISKKIDFKIVKRTLKCKKCNCILNTETKLNSFNILKEHYNTLHNIKIKRDD